MVAPIKKLINVTIISATLVGIITLHHVLEWTLDAITFQPKNPPIKILLFQNDPLLFGLHFSHFSWL
jgi:hypothetical protein